MRLNTKSRYAVMALADLASSVADLSRTKRMKSNDIGSSSEKRKDRKWTFGKVKQSFGKKGGPFWRGIWEGLPRIDEKSMNFKKSR